MLLLNLNLDAGTGLVVTPQVSGGWSAPLPPTKEQTKKKRIELGILPPEAQKVVIKVIDKAIREDIGPKARNKEIRRDLSQKQIKTGVSDEILLQAIKNAYNDARNREIAGLIDTSLEMKRIRQEEEGFLLLLMAA